jgi:DNA-binding CsgD family transcriptional regulator
MRHALNEFLTLWRHNPKRPFTEEERQAKELLMPHIADAHRVARLREVLDNPHDKRECWAVTDEHGFLREISPAFVHWLRREWPTWRGSALPDGLSPLVRDAKLARFGNQHLHVEKRGIYRYLQVTAIRVLDNLSEREHEIVERYAQGETYVVIASALGLSPATVRNHIAHCYRKLSVNNKAELVLRLSNSK